MTNSSQYCRDYYAKNRAQIYKNNLKWRAKNREKIRMMPSSSSKKRKEYRLRHKIKNPEQWANRNRKYSENFRKRFPKRALFFNRVSRLKKPEHYKQKAYDRHRKIWSDPILRKAMLLKSSLWANRNPEKHQAKYWRYKARKIKATVDESGILDFVKSVKSKPTTICSYCKKVIPSKGCHFDHIVPLSRGGPHCLKNLCVCCRSCNSSKGTKMISEWLNQKQKTPCI